MEYKDTFSPVYDPNNTKPETGMYHNWVSFDGAYYGPAYKCANCNAKSWGWNLWKEDFLPVCTNKQGPQDVDDINASIQHMVAMADTRCQFCKIIGINSCSHTPIEALECLEEFAESEKNRVGHISDDIQAMVEHQRQKVTPAEMEERKRFWITLKQKHETYKQQTGIDPYKQWGAACYGERHDLCAVQLTTHKDGKEISIKCLCPCHK